MGATTPRKLPPTAEILDLGKVPDAEIARRYGVSRERVHQVRLRAGVAASVPHPGLPFERLVEIAVAAEGALSIADAARRAGTTKATIRRRGLVPPVRLGPAEALVLRALHDDPQSGEALALWLDTPERHASRILRRLAAKGLVEEGTPRALLAPDWSLTTAGRDRAAALTLALTRHGEDR